MPFPSPGDLSNSGIEPTCPAMAGGFFTTEPPGTVSTDRGDGQREKKTTEFSVIWGKRPYNLTWGKEHVHPSLSSAILKIFLACRNSQFTNFVFNPEKFLVPKEPNRTINKPPTHKGGGR